MFGTFHRCLAMLSPQVRRAWYGLIPWALAGGAIEALMTGATFKVVALLSQPELARAPWIRMPEEAVPEVHLLHRPWSEG
jgi:hypothetical protein